MSFFKKNFFFLTVLLIAAALTVSACDKNLSCLDETVIFNEQVVGDKYFVSDEFTDYGTLFTVLPLYDPYGDWHLKGEVVVTEEMPVDSYGKNISLFLKGAGIGLNACPTDFVGFRYCEKSGGVNLFINGVFGNEYSILDFQGRDFGGVKVNVIRSGENCGIVELAGKFEPFHFRDQYWIDVGIGGQGLYIDSLTTWSYQD